MHFSLISLIGPVFHKPLLAKKFFSMKEKEKETLKTMLHSFLFFSMASEENTTNHNYCWCNVLHSNRIKAQSYDAVCIWMMHMNWNWGMDMNLFCRLVSNHEHIQCNIKSYIIATGDQVNDINIESSKSTNTEVINRPTHDWVAL